MEEEQKKREQIIDKLIQKRKQEINAFTKLLEAIKSNQTPVNEKIKKEKGGIGDSENLKNNKE